MENKLKEILDENQELHQGKLNVEKKLIALQGEYDEIAPKYTELINASNHMKDQFELKLGRMEDNVKSAQDHEARFQRKLTPLSS